MTHPMLDTTQWDAANPDPSLVIADGPSVTVNLYDGVLVIEDGPKEDRRKTPYPRVPRTMRRLVILSPHGYISMDAQRWLADCEITWFIFDRMASVPRILATSASSGKVKLRRAQAYAGRGGPWEHRGVQIVRGFIMAKLSGQIRNAEFLGKPAEAKQIRQCLDAVELCDDLDALGGWEGRAAVAYWAAWRGTPVSWVYPKPLKPHWRAYPGRPTLRRSYADNRGATDPVNAMFNYGYRVAETECLLALTAAGFDPEMGIDHKDETGRASFALDLLEVMRPHVDAAVISVLSEPLDKRLFQENSEGIVKVASPLTHRLVSEVKARACYLTPEVERTVKILTES